MGIVSPVSPSVRSAERRTSYALSSVPQGLTLVLGDVLSLLVAAALMPPVMQLLGRPVGTFPDVLVWGGLWLIWRACQGLYPGYGRSPQTELQLHVMGTVQTMAVQLTAALALNVFAPAVPGVLVMWLALLFLALPVRYGLRSLLIRWGHFGRPVSVIGAGQTAELAIAHLCQHRSYGLNPVYAYDDNPSLHGHHVRGIPVLGPIELALAEPRTQQALISIPGARADTQRWLINGIYNAFPFTWVIPDLFGVPNQALKPHSIGAIASLEIRDNLRSIRSRLIKRIFDLLLVTIFTLFSIPLLIGIAVAIRLEGKGPIIYKALRLGRNGETFPCYKFRSMYEDADQRLHGLLATHPELSHEYEKFHKLKQDPRVTRVGALLRKTSLDELPQLANVLMGQMSLVGPRPYLPRESEKIGQAVESILRVRPGITGFWQVNDRSESTFAQRVDMDQFYIANWTPWLDIIILIQTIGVVLNKKGAY